MFKKSLDVLNFRMIYLEFSGPNVHHATVVGEGYPLVDLEVKILRLVVDTLLYTMEHTDQELFCQVAVRLAKVLCPSSTHHAFAN